jgi:hypothetical protein
VEGELRDGGDVPIAPVLTHKHPRKTEGCARPSQPDNPHSSAVFTQVHNSL